MAVGVISRPVGYILGDQFFSTFGCTSSSGDALFSSVAVHGLTDGDVIYIYTDIEDYAGFWTVDVQSTTTWKLVDPAGGFVPFVSTLINKLFYFRYTDGEQNWSCVHLPIVYELASDLSPTNSSDTARTVSSFTDAAGLTNLNLSGALKAAVNTLNYVQISGASDDTLNGVFQITDAVSTSDVTINLPYDVANDFTGASVQFYYDNYHININVYGGIPSTHPLYISKPVELLATLSLTPDVDGQVKFSINEIIKSQIKTLNNLSLGTLPNNINAWTGFYIEYGESYDESDGEDITYYTSAYTSDVDDFEGYAINAMLPFKNVHSGFMSDYVDGLWLTLFDRLQAVEDRYFDISFIKNVVGAFTITLDKYVSDYLTATEIISYDDQGVGVYRIPIEPDSNYDSFCARITTVASGGTSAISLPALSAWATRTTSPGYVDWTTGATPTVNLPVATSEILYAAYAFVPGNEYTIILNFTRTVNSGSSNPRTAKLEIYNDSFVAQFTETLTAIAGAQDITITFTATHFCTQIGFWFSSGSDVTIVINSRAGTETTPTVLAEDITDEICIDIEANCEGVREFVWLTWLNPLGGFDYWLFTGYTDHGLQVTETGETKVNIFPNWPQSYGPSADTITKQTFRRTRKQKVIRTQTLTSEQATQLGEQIRSSPLVQIISNVFDGIVSRVDRRTVIVDSDSVMVRREMNKMHTLSFGIAYTDEYPSQRI